MIILQFTTCSCADLNGGESDQPGRGFRATHIR
jgi:hypothetical protein